MKKLFISLLCGALSLGAIGALSSPALALDIDVNCDGLTEEECSKTIKELNEKWEKGELGSTASEGSTNEMTKTEIAPTFSTELNENEHSVTFKLGHNLILTGNNLISEVSNKSGFMLAAGNNLSLRTNVEYGILLGNTINFAGETVRDLYIAGNTVTLTHDAKIGRDVFAATNTLTIDTDIAGDLAVTADTVVLKDIKIAGNLNLSVAHLEIVGKVEVAGAFVYNDNADVSGLEKIKASSTEAYHVEEIDQAALMVARIYGRIMSLAALFLIMALICAFYPRLHEKLETEATVGRFGTNLAIGLGLLIAVPIVAIFAFFTLVAAPLGIIALAVYLIAIYLAQGFAGAWLGHVIIEKLCKGKGNIFVETLLGLFILYVCSLIPYLGIITGFLGLLLGLGLIMSCIKPVKKVKK